MPQSVQDPSYTKPLPRITPLNRGFWDYARQSVLALQSCSTCGDTHFPATPVCPRCLGTDQSWKPSKGRGTLISWVDFHRAYWDGFNDELPYRTCLVRLDEGPLLISNLVGDPDMARMGARLHVIFDCVSNDVTLPKFTFD